MSRPALPAPSTLDHGWPGTASVAAALAAEPEQFDFLQAVHLTEQLLAASGLAPHSALHLSARGSFAFPPSAMLGWRQSAHDGSVEITTALLALNGALGPLPWAYHEDQARTDPATRSAFAAFLDLFHGRLLRLLYEIARLPQPALGSSHHPEHPISGALLALAGLGHAELRDRQAVADSALTRYAALLASPVRSAHGLAQALMDFTGLPVSIEGFQGAWASLDASQQTRLGAQNPQCTLGSKAVLGRRVWDDHAGLALVFGTDAHPLRRADFHALLSGGWRRAAIEDLTRLYLRAEFRFAFCLTIAPEAVPPTWLGRARLGRTSFLLTRASARPVTIRTQPVEPVA